MLGWGGVGVGGRGVSTQRWMQSGQKSILHEENACKLFSDPDAPVWKRNPKDTHRMEACHFLNMKVDMHNSPNKRFQQQPRQISYLKWSYSNCNGGSLLHISHTLYFYACTNLDIWIGAVVWLSDYLNTVYVARTTPKCQKPSLKVGLTKVVCDVSSKVAVFWESTDWIPHGSCSHQSATIWTLGKKSGVLHHIFHIFGLFTVQQSYPHKGYATNILSWLLVYWCSVKSFYFWASVLSSNHMRTCHWMLLSGNSNIFHPLLLLADIAKNTGIGKGDYFPWWCQ